MKPHKFYTVLIFVLVYSNLFSLDSLGIIKRKKIVFTTLSVSATTSSLIYLNQAWYQSYSTSAFHTFNDNAEWFQLDKCGHAFTTYQTARLMMNAMEHAGYSNKQIVLIGGLTGFTYMGAIELMDGYSKGWGFSWGDLAANALGSGLAITQKLLWKDQRILIKYSFQSSPYAKYNTSLLGQSLATQLLKDYNGQTYWLSINPSSFMKPTTQFPKWLNIAIGYGANGMIGARDNALPTYDVNGNSIYFKRYQQAYLSLDVDFTRIKTHSKLLKTLFSSINMLKIPFPNIELSEHTLKFNYY